MEKPKPIPINTDEQPLDLFNARLRQIVILVILLALIFVVIAKFYAYVPGVLGAIAMYILSRSNYFQLVYFKKWKPWKAAMTYVLYYMLIIGLPVFLAITLITPKINTFMANPDATLDNVRSIAATLQQKTGIKMLSAESINGVLEKATAFVPRILGGMLTLVINLTIMLFFFYFMLRNAKDMESTLYRITPLKDENTVLLAAETKRIVTANALGLPIIAIIQAIVAGIGYAIFGVDDWAIWAFFTGVFAFVPIIGTTAIWGTIVLVLYAKGDTFAATGVLLYSIIITANADYVARITIMKKIGDVHPLVTIPGIIIGVNIFGVMGLVFGPLLIGYIMVVFKIYINEFVANRPMENTIPDEIPNVTLHHSDKSKMTE